MSATLARASTPAPAPSHHPDLLVDGWAVVYRLYDVGYEISLDRAAELAEPSGRSRSRPQRLEARSLVIPNPPLTIALGTVPLDLGGRTLTAELSALVFDFGVISLRLRAGPGTVVRWDEFVAFGAELDVGTDLSPIFERQLAALIERVGPAITRPAVAPVTEDYIVYRIVSLRDPAGLPIPPTALHEEDLTALLLSEPRPLAEATRRFLLPHRFSYTPDDLTVLSWDNALVVEPVADDADVEYILEFANAQLLEVRVFDAMLDAQLPLMYDRVAAARHGSTLLRRRYHPVLTDLHTLVADTTELVERAENALKVTNDVFLGRIYSAALALFRADAWRHGVDRKLAIIRETYGMLNAEAQAARAELLELAIVLLIVGEILLSLARGG